MSYHCGLKLKIKGNILAFPLLNTCVQSTVSIATQPHRFSPLTGDIASVILLMM